MSATNVRAGRAYVEIAADSSRLGRDLRAAQTQIRGFGDSVRNIGLQLGTLFSGAALSGGILNSAKSFADAGSALDDLSQRSGASVESLGALSLAAKLSDTSMETLGKGFAKMQLLIVKASKGNDEAVDAIQSLGLNLRSLARLSPDKQFEAFAGAIAKLQDPALRANAAVSVFSKSGLELLPMLMEGKDGLRDLAKEARDLGLVMSGKDAASAAVFGDTLDKLRMSLTAVYNKIGAALAPMLNRITNIFIGVSAAVTQWLDKNRGIIALVAPIVAALGSAGASAIGLGLAFKIAAIAVGPALLAALIAVKSAIVTVAGVLAAVAIPALAVAAAIGGLTATMYALGITWTDVATTIANVWASAMSFIGNSLSPVGTFIANWVSKIVDGFAWMHDGATQYFGAIGKALADGNLEGAGQVAMAGLTRAFRGGFNVLYGYYLAFIEGWKSSWDMWTTGLADVFVVAWTSIESTFTDTISYLGQMWTLFTTGLTIAWNSSIGFIQKAWVRLKAMFDKHINVTAETNAIDQRTLDANGNAFASGESAIVAREKQRRERQSQIQVERTTMIGTLESDRQRRQTERAQATDSLMGQANAQFDTAKQNYEASIKAVQEFKPDFKSRKNKFGFDPESLLSETYSPEKSVTEAKTRIESKGTFSAFGARGLQSDSVEKSSAETAKNTAAMLQWMKQNPGARFI
ncbi:MAG: hypothetical protein ACK5OC_13935 [Pirellula sp.]|jgi:hypothetical protein